MGSSISPWGCFSPSCCSKLPPASPPHPLSFSTPPHHSTSTVLGGQGHQPGLSFKVSLPLLQPPFLSEVLLLLRRVWDGTSQPALAPQGFWDRHGHTGDCRDDFKMRAGT